MIASLIYLVIYLIVVGVVIWLLTLPPRTDIASSAGVVYPSRTRANKHQAAQPAAALMSALGHVWTAPWQELSDASAALVGCGHVSGLLMRRVWPLALMLCADRVPNKNAHFRGRALTRAGSPDPRNDRICITSSCPRQFRLRAFDPRMTMPLSAAILAERTALRVP